MPRGLRRPVQAFLLQVQRPRVREAPQARDPHADRQLYERVRSHGGDRRVRDRPRLERRPRRCLRHRQHGRQGAVGGRRRGRAADEVPRGGHRARLCRVDHLDEELAAKVPRPDRALHQRHRRLLQERRRARGQGRAALDDRRVWPRHPRVALPHRAAHRLLLRRAVSGGALGTARDGSQALLPPTRRDATNARPATRRRHRRRLLHRRARPRDDVLQAAAVRRGRVRPRRLSGFAGRGSLRRGGAVGGAGPHL
mmetsp:Transcript_33747/g.72010  ORF Transcript_33747/g.72010 Transcript_33747/m.72010 type:complete len:254 (+) Transcript_33747:575-1336(+)